MPYGSPDGGRNSSIVLLQRQSWVMWYAFLMCATMRLWKGKGVWSNVCARVGKTRPDLFSGDYEWGSRSPDNSRLPRMENNERARDWRLRSSFGNIYSLVCEKHSPSAFIGAHHHRHTPPDFIRHSRVGQHTPRARFPAPTENTVAENSRSRAPCHRQVQTRQSGASTLVAVATIYFGAPICQRRKQITSSGNRNKKKRRTNNQTICIAFRRIFINQGRANNADSIKETTQTPT